MNKCKGCEWYNKPYWSIISPCENCPREEINVEITTDEQIAKESYRRNTYV